MNDAQLTAIDHAHPWTGALLQADAAIRTFLTAWAESLPAEQQARVADWLAGGLALGLDALVTADAPQFAVTLTDHTGARQVLATVAPDMPGADTSRVH